MFKEERCPPSESDGGGGGIAKTTSALKFKRPFLTMQNSTNSQ